jgi:uncharacterized MAPEG superfamily protein
VSLAYWCVLFAGVLPYLALLPAKLDKEIDNRNPRDRHTVQTGLPRRAYAAHLNGLEAFPFFAAAVILAGLTGAPAFWLDVLAAFFIVARILYVLAYWSDRASLRSAVWAVGFVTVLAIFSLPAFTR